jgi:signal transduction histidine kinase
MKDEFLATISHELRTPLTAILGWASMLTHGTLSKLQTRRALQVIEQSAKSQAGWSTTFWTLLALSPDD